MKNIVVLYHKNCTDGFGAAWAAWKKLGHKADYIAVGHHEPPPEKLQGKKVYIIDFSYDEPTTRCLIKDNKQVTIIDHHSDKESIIQLSHDYRYDPTHSGAVLSWQYFHPGKKIPQLLKYVEDYDLWRFAILHTKEIGASLGLSAYDFNKWNIIARDIEGVRTRKKYIVTGTTILKYRAGIVERLITNNAQLVMLEGHRVLAVNSPNFRDDIGYALYTAMPPFGIIWHQAGNKIVVSLRSDGTVNVATIAKKLNPAGGGHPQAAGVTLNAQDPLPWKPVNP